MASSYNQKSSSSASRQPKPTYRKAGRKAGAPTRPQTAPVRGSGGSLGSLPPRGQVPQRRGLSAHSPYAQPARSRKAPAGRPAARKQPQLPSRTGGAPARGQIAPAGGSPMRAGGARRLAAPSVDRSIGRPQVAPHRPAGKPPVGVNVPRSASSAQAGAQARLATSQPKVGTSASSKQRASDGLIKRIAKRSRGASSGADISAALKQRRSPAHDTAGRAPGRGPARIIGIVIGVVLALIIVGGVGFTFVANAGFFSATDIQLRATEHISQDVLEKLVDVPEGTTLLNVDVDAIAADLRENPWVESVSVERQFPHTLVITPVERKVFALVYISTGGISWAVDRSGQWIAPVSLETSAAGSDGADAGSDASADATSDGAADTGSADGAGTSSDASGTGSDTASTGYNAALELAQHLGAVLITDVGTDIDPKSGSSVTDEGVSTALSYARGFSADFLSQVRSISAASPEACALYLANGVEVALGTAGNIQDKETVVEQILSDRTGVTYINVRNPENPTWREVQIS